MFDSVQFFKQRFKEHLKELNRYLRYIFNGHIAFALFFFISAFAVYYQKLLQELPDDFPAALLMGVVFGLVVRGKRFSTHEESRVVFSPFVKILRFDIGDIDLYPIFVKK